MPRVWLTCALVTAAVVAGVLVFTNRPSAEANGGTPKGPKAPPPLSEQEIRTYLDVMPTLTNELGAIAMKLQRKRIEAGGQLDAETEKALQIESQSIIDALLERNHLTRETWHRLSERVEYVVNAVRAEPELEKARPEIQEKLELKKALLEKLGNKDERAMVEKEIANLERLLAGEGPPITERDRELIRQFWGSLDPLVPRRGPPGK